MGAVLKAVASMWDMFFKSGLPCLASVGEDEPSKDLMCQGGRIPRGTALSEEKGRRHERRIL